MEKNNTKTMQDMCLKLLNAYKEGYLGDTTMPEDTHPKFKQIEERLSYFTLPMALNYQRNSFALWESAKSTFEDPETLDVFNLYHVSTMPREELQKKLRKHKLALQPNKHTATWIAIANTIYKNFETYTKLFESMGNDFLKLKETMQIIMKKDFPYISGPKIFNYWSFIISDPRYGQVDLTNKSYIEIAPDTHIIKCSVKLGVISNNETDKLSRDQISERWRNILNGTGINPIEMHAPLWFWSKNDFLYQL